MTNLSRAPTAKITLSRDNLLWLLVAQGCVILPLLWRLPGWLWIVWMGALVWRIQIFRGHWKFPSTLVKFLVGVSCVGGLLASYSGVVGVEPMVGFLVCSFVLKLVEMRSRKDALLVLFIGFIAIAAQFLFAQTLVVALYGALCASLLVTAWQAIYFTGPVSNRVKFVRSNLLLLQSLPLMVVLFIGMPRIGPLWAVPLPETAAQTGFDDTLSPGDIGNLVRSSETAFRVTFEAQAPPPSALYWRGIVLERFDGRTWHSRDDWQTKSNSPNPSKATSEATDLLSYSIVLEPHQRHWLFSLMMPLKVQSSLGSARITDKHLLRSRIPIANRMQYQVTSANQYASEASGLSTEEYFANLQVPEDANPKARQLVNRWLAAGYGADQVIDSVLALFNESFRYTLRPPKLGQHSVDEFLFDSQRGFCEHFASSFVVLMRFAGIPARVVVGYQGGTYSRVDNYLMVSQADAHAWAEVWLEGKGWIRVDPTAAVAPSRIEHGINDALTPEEKNLIGEGYRQSPVLSFLYQHWDAVGHSWHRWVLGYDKSSQAGLLKKLLGGVEPWRSGLALVGGGVLIIGAYMLLFMRRSRYPLSPELIAFRAFLKKTERFGMYKQTNETATAYATRVGEEHPSLRVPARQIALLFNKTAYCGERGALRHLQRHVRAFPSLPSRKR